MIKRSILAAFSIQFLLFCVMPKCHAQARTNIQPASMTPASAQSEKAGHTDARSDAANQKNEPAAPAIAPVQNQPEPAAINHASENNPLRKAARGAVNATLGWVEIPRQIIKENKGKKNVKSILWGPVKGFSYFVSRTAVGIYEITTFLIPPYKPVVDPEFIFPEDEK